MQLHTHIPSCTLVHMYIHLLVEYEYIKRIITPWPIICLTQTGISNISSLAAECRGSHKKQHTLVIKQIQLKLLLLHTFYHVLMVSTNAV